MNTIHKKLFWVKNNLWKHTYQRPVGLSVSPSFPWEVEMIRIDLPRAMLICIYKETKRKQANRWINPASYYALRKNNSRISSRSGSCNNSSLQKWVVFFNYSLVSNTWRNDKFFWRNVHFTSRTTAFLQGLIIFVCREFSKWNKTCRKY